MQLALTGADLGAVAVPFLGDSLGGEVSFDQVRRTPAAPARAGWSTCVLLRLAARPCSRISAATVFSLTLSRCWERVIWREVARGVVRGRVPGGAP